MAAKLEKGRERRCEEQWFVHHLSSWCLLQGSHLGVAHGGGLNLELRERWRAMDLACTRLARPCSGHTAAGPLGLDESVKYPGEFLHLGWSYGPCCELYHPNCAGRRRPQNIKRGTFLLRQRQFKLSSLLFKEQQLGSPIGRAV